MHAETNVELLEAVWDGHRAMARLANPGLADYSRIYPPTNEEGPIANQGSATIEPVGYDPDRKTILYSPVLGAGEHLRGWEILALRAAVLAKKLPDGRAVERIEVIFPDEAMARGEMRPLRDVGVEVGYYGEKRRPGLLAVSARGIGGPANSTGPRSRGCASSGARTRRSALFANLGAAEQKRQVLHSLVATNARSTP